MTTSNNAVATTLEYFRTTPVTQTNRFRGVTSTPALEVGAEVLGLGFALFEEKDITASAEAYGLLK